MRTASILSILILLAVAPASSKAALGDHQWSSGWDSGGLATPDGSGHIAAAGTFFSATDFGGGTLTPSNFLGGDFFLARFDNAGNHVWSKSITPGGFGVTVTAVSAAPDGTIYVAGGLQNGDIDFGGGTLSGSNDTYLVAFDSAGNHIWSFVAGNGTIRDLTANNSLVAITGYTFGSIDFGGGILTTSGDADMIVAALNSNASHRFSQIYGAAANGSGGMSVAVGPSDEIVVLASTEDAVDFGGGTLTPSGFDTEPCLIKFNSSGVHQWSWIRAGSFSPGGGILLSQFVDISSTGEIALAGQFEASVDMGGGTITSDGSFDVFLARYDTDGAHLSSDHYGGTAHDAADGVSYDSANNIALAGSFLSTSPSFGGATLTHSGNSGSDLFAAIYDPGGTHLFSTSYVGNSGYLIIPKFNSADGLLLTGGGSGLDFGGGPLASANFYMATIEGANTPTPSTSPLRRAILAQNSPNPFNPSTAIRYELAVAGRIRLEIFDLRGRSVRQLLDATMPAGTHDFQFDGRDDQGRPLASGVYRYQLQTATDRLTRSMVLLK